MGPSRDAFGATPGAQVWRSKRSSRIMSAAFGAVFGGLTCLFFWTSGDELIGVAAWLIVAAGVWRWAFRPWIGLDGAQVVVVNPVFSVVVPLSTITGVESGYSGIEISCVDGHTETAWAVQKANVNVFLGRQTRSDDVVAEILRAVGPN